jgi:hypothetical protein
MSRVSKQRLVILKAYNVKMLLFGRKAKIPGKMLRTETGNTSEEKKRPGSGSCPQNDHP